MRHPHYWRIAGAAKAPGEIIVVDTETYHGDDVLTESGEWHTLRIGCAIAYRLERGKRTRVQKLTFTRADEFWSLVRKRMNKSRPVWIVGHNLPYDLGILCGWKTICSKEYATEKLCISGQMFYVKGGMNGEGLNFLDTVNYYHCSLDKIGKSVGLPKMDMPHISDSDAKWGEYCMNDVEVTARGIEAVIAFIRENALGPFQPSIAGCAFAAYRSSFMRHRVLVHCNKHALALERAAYFGGIVDTAYIGTVPDDAIYELDVCSMYPAMCTRPLPFKLEGYGERVSLARLKHLAKQYMVFADVTITNTDTPYPCKGKYSTYYPIGTFRTTLAHPELMDAVDRGVVTRVHACSWYHHAPIFAEYMKFFVDKKIDYTKLGNEAFANVCKLFATNLYGKTGQLTHKWREWGKDSLQQLEQIHGLPPESLAEFYHNPPDTYHYDAPIYLPGIPDPIESRSDYGILEIKIGEYESRDSCPAIAACVTSYARVYIRELQRQCGAGNWFYTDTDSIWTNTHGFCRLEERGYVRDQQLGFLDLKWLHGRMDIYGPKDYETYMVRKRKGVRLSAKPDGKGGWEQLHFPGPLQQIRSGLSSGVMVERIVKHLHRQITRCVPMPDGYTRPLVYPGENPELAGKRSDERNACKTNRTTKNRSGSRNSRYRSKVWNQVTPGGNHTDAPTRGKTT